MAQHAGKMGIHSFILTPLAARPFEPGSCGLYDTRGMFSWSFLYSGKARQESKAHGQVCCPLGNKL